MVITELIDSMRGHLDDRPGNVAAEVLALEYARQCREVNERLGKIALMLEGGGEIQALQHAEQAPRVVDAALALSFGGESVWQEYCRDHGHEVAPMVDARTLEALLEIQGKGLASNHPLYKDYRAAVSSRDDERAHGLIRIIARMNPGDGNAAKELKRLQRKALQAALGTLRVNLDGSDELLLDAMTQVEDSGMAEDYESLPEWKQAVLVRNRIRRAAARVRMPVALRLAAEELEKGEWRQSAVFHGEYRVLESTFGLADEQTDLEDQARAIEVELTKYRTAAERTAQARHLVSEMERIAEDVETRAVTPRGLSSDFAAPLVEDLTRKLRQLEGLRGEITNSSRTRIEAARGQLVQSIERSHRSKRLRLVGGLVVASLILLAAAGAGALALRASGQTDLMSSLRGQQSASAVRNLVERIKNDEPLLLRFPRLAAELAQATRWLEAMDANLSLANRELTQLEEARRGGFAEMGSPDLFEKLEETGNLVSQLPADLAADTSSRLTLLRNDGERQLMKRQSERDRLARLLTDRWSAAVEKINLNGPAVDAGRALDPAPDEIAPFLKLASHDHPILRLPASTAAMITDVDSRVRKMKDRYEAASNALAALSAAETMAAYREATAQLASCSFSEGAAAQAILDAWPDEDRLKALLVFRGDLVALKTASNETLDSIPMPEEAVALDREVISRLISSESLNSWVLEWKTTAGATKSSLCAGKLTWDPKLEYIGKLAPYPKYSSETLKFKEQAIAKSVVVSNKPTPTAAMMSRLDLSHLLDETGTKFQKSVLPLLDWVANDTQAKPLAKAYVYGQLLRLIRNHKPEEWGLNYCPGLIDEIKAFQELALKSPMPETAWLLEKAPDYAKAWQAYFSARGQRSSFDELRQTHAAAAAVLRGSIDLAGRLDAEGNCVLSPGSDNRLLLAVCDMGEEGHKLKVCGIAEAKAQMFTPSPKALPLSPLFSINLPEDTQAFLLSIHRNDEANHPKPPQP
jgi:hypothetical protein